MTAEEVFAELVIGCKFIELERIFTQRRQDPENPEKWERISLGNFAVSATLREN
jgi:hypothetical protein